jgi:hypothetical protein
MSSLVKTGATASSMALFKPSCGAAARQASIGALKTKHAIVIAAIVLNFIPHISSCYRTVGGGLIVSAVDVRA